MTLRPIPARWFELITVGKELPRVLECLARTGAVELETRSGTGDHLWLPDVDEHLKSHRDLARRYHAYWPAPVSQGQRSDHVIETLSAARQRLIAWPSEADPIIAEIERISQQLAELEQLSQALRLLGADLPDLKLLADAGPRLQARLLLLPVGTRLREIPPLVLFKPWETPTSSYVLLVGRQPDIRDLEMQLPGLKGRAIRFPAWLAPSPAAALATVSERIANLTAERAALQSGLAELSTRLRIAEALGEMAFFEWLHRHATKLRGSERLAWVTGWTSDPKGTAVGRALDAEHLRYILKLSEADADAAAPLVLRNPPWARMFEVFSRMLGMPARNESDPSIALAVIAPVIFGFMFGDVGQGIILCIAGLAFGARIPLVRILISGGIMAIFFGLLFGSVFSREDIIPALWVRPLADPITILVVAVVLGVVVLSIGMLLDAIQAYWRGDGWRWWGNRAGLAVAYLGLIAATMRLEGLLLAAFGALWFIGGATLLDKKPGIGALARACAELVEQALRLIVNTISFARAGAFALAHAGLSTAIISLAVASGRAGYWIVLVLGNLLVIALEGMIVSIQTTRLMLFEFFIRFLTAGGREFKPLPPPEIAGQTSSSQA